MKIIQCQFERHGESILDIFNEAIANTTALYEYKPRSIDDIKTWFASKEEGNYPVIGIEDTAQQLMGFATYSLFRTRAGYKYSIEHSIYVDARFRKKGIGTALMKALIAKAEEEDYHTMIGGIDESNEVSIQFHKSLGFKHCGTIKETAFKFNRWLDLGYYQLLLKTPKIPTEK